MKYKLYVAYGSNLNLEQMAARCPTAKVVATGKLLDYQLVFHHVATVEPKNGSAVPVAVWAIDEACERSLDRYEGYPRLYRKETLPVQVGKDTVKAMVYVMNGCEAEMPSRTYFDIILQGYYDCGLNTDYLEQALKETQRQAG